MKTSMRSVAMAVLFAVSSAQASSISSACSEAWYFETSSAYIAWNPWTSPPQAGDDAWIYHSIWLSDRADPMPATVDGLYLCAGGIQGAGTYLDILHHLEWTNGYLANGSFYYNNQTSSAPSHLNGGVLQIASDGTFWNEGHIIQGSGELELDGKWRNTAQSSYELQSNALISGSGSFRNDSTIRRTGAGTSRIEADLHGTNGTIEVTEGTLELAGGGAITGGLWQVGSGASLDLTATQNWTLVGDLQGTGTGTVRMLNGSIVIATRASFNFPNGGFRWAGGTCDGFLTNFGLWRFEGDATRTIYQHGALHNYGTVTHEGSGALDLNGQTAMRDMINFAGGLYDLKSDGTNVLTSWNSRFDNFGTVRKSDGAGTSVLDLPFYNHQGTVDVQSGTLVLRGSGALSNGLYHAATGTVLDLTGGENPRVYGALRGDGPGQVVLASGQFFSGSRGVLLFTNGGFTWAGGIIDGVITNAGLMILDGTAAKTLSSGARLDNESILIHKGTGDLHLNQCYLFNRPGAEYDIQVDGSNITYESSVVFSNFGLIRKSGGSGTSVINAVLHNNGGTVQVQTGTLILRGGGWTRDVNYDVWAGAAVDLTGGSGPKFLGTLTGTGSGDVLLASGQFLQNSGAALNFTNAGGLRWQGGGFDGHVTNIGLCRIEGDGTKTMWEHGGFRNRSTVIQTGSGALNLSDPDWSFSNEVDGVYEIQSDGTNIITTWGGQFANLGLFRKTAGTGASYVTASFRNYGGTVDVQTGSLLLKADGLFQGGAYEVAGSALELIASNKEAKCTGTLTGGGAGRVSFAGRIDDNSAAVFAFTNGGLEWAGNAGMMGRNTNAGICYVTGDVAGKWLGNGQYWYNAGTIVHEGKGGINISNGRMYNDADALYDLQNDGTNLWTDWTAYFYNYGTFRKSAGTGESRVAIDHFENHGGTVEVQAGTLRFNTFTHTGGVIRLAGGDLIVPSFTLQAGLLEGTGTVSIGTLTSSGTTRPGLSAGVLHIGGHFTQNAAGTLDIEIGGETAGTEYDQLAVASNASLNGTLNVTLTNSYMPPAARRFTILTTASRSGVFSSTNLPALTGDLFWIVRYTNAAVELRVGSSADTDGDALDDGWENGEFGNLAASDGMDDDYDLDGFTDYEEFVALTQPTNPASYLRIDNVECIRGGSNTLVTTASSTGVAYRLEWTPSLLTDPIVWTACDTNSGDGLDITMTNLTGDVLLRYYRLQAERE